MVIRSTYFSVLRNDTFLRSSDYKFTFSSNYVGFSVDWESFLFRFIDFFPSTGPTHWSKTRGLHLTFLVRCLWIDDTSARNVINPLAPWSLLTSFETNIIMVYVIMARGKGLIREDSCHLCKERGSREPLAQKARICFARRSSRFPKTPPYPYELHYAFGSLKDGDVFLVSFLYTSRRTLISMFYETVITSWFVQGSLGASFDLILASYF